MFDAGEARASAGAGTLPSDRPVPGGERPDAPPPRPRSSLHAQPGRAHAQPQQHGRAALASPEPICQLPLQPLRQPGERGAPSSAARCRRSGAGPPPAGVGVARRRPPGGDGACHSAPAALGVGERGGGCARRAARRADLAPARRAGPAGAHWAQPAGAMPMWAPWPHPAPPAAPRRSRCCGPWRPRTPPRAPSPPPRRSRTRRRTTTPPTHVPCPPTRLT